ncbi:MAG: SLC13 family permease [Oscillospiraceae bacterium]
MQKILRFIKKETVLTISFVLAVGSMFITPPNAGYLNYVNYSVIALLFCLMVAVQGFSAEGLPEYLSKKLTSRIQGSRMLAAVLTALCFFLSMLMTNDVALITFVPMTLMLFKGRQELLIRTIVLETAAANLGSMATPVGNPQNLYIYSHYNYSPADFFAVMLPLSGICLILLALSQALIPNEQIEQDNTKTTFKPTKCFWVYCGIFAASLCTVARLLDYRICLAATLAALAIANRKIFAKVDYALLGTFVCFFVFVGNISAVPEIRSLIAAAADGKELLLSCGLSQIISNVPCAIMLSGFTDNSDALLRGVNIGGMGTLIASLASLISYKLYVRSDGAKKGRFFLEFSIYNFVFLGILLAIALIFFN